MKSQENGVLEISDYYVYTSSIQAQNTFFNVVYVGHFYYDANYTLERCNDDSYLIMLIEKGHCKITIDGMEYNVSENQVVFLDCSKPHSYSSVTQWQTLWVHFRGSKSKEYYNLITKKAGHVIDLFDSYTFVKRLDAIYQVFKNNQVIKEFIISKYITDLLTELILVSENNKTKIDKSYNSVEVAIKFMRENISEKITLDEIAMHVSLSPYYFTRLFKKETDLTPYQYLIDMRIDLAKFLLKNSDCSIKQICFETGFNSESMFCSTFKRRVKISPSNYRKLTAPNRIKC